MKKLGTKKEWATLTMCLGVGVLFVAINLLVRSLEFDGCPTAQGVVISVETQGDGIVTKKRSFAQVRYTDAAGKVHQAALNERLRIGRSIQVAYKKDDPTKIRNMEHAISRDKALLQIGISGLVTLLSVACLLWPAKSSLANHQPVVTDTKSRSINWLRGLGLIGVGLAIVLGGIAGQRNAYKTVKTTTVAEVVRSSAVGLSQPGLVARYEDQNGTARYTVLDAKTNHKPGDRISFQYQAKSTAEASKLYTRPWLQVVFLALCCIVAAVVVASNSTERQDAAQAAN